jgi:hypothetical protein
MSYEQINQRDGCIFHLVDNAVDPGNDIVVKDLQDNGHNKA